jgi:dienelactone hydrolase
MRSRYLIALSTLVLFIVVGGCGPSGEQCSTTGTCGDCLDSDDCGTDDCTTASCLDLVGDATNCGVAGRICTDAATGIVDGRCENGGCACDAPSDCQGEGLNVDSCALGDGDALRCLCAGYTVNGVEAPCPLGLACVEGGCLFDGDIYATSDALNAALDGPCVPRSTYRDEDGDGFGNPDVVTPACTAAAGWVDNALDCSDVDSARYPGAPLRPATDSNCDGFIDNDVDGDGVSDVSTDVDFDPMVQRHVELAEVAATVPFAVEVHAGEVDPRGVEVLSTSGFSRVLVWDASRRTLSGTVRDAGAYTEPLSVCRVFPFDEAQCALATNRRVDLAHLTVQAAQPPEQAPTVAATGPYRAAFRDVVLDVSGILRDFDVRFLPRLAEGLTDPTRQQELLGLATASPMRVIYPALPDSDDVAAGQFPLVVVLHGNGYHWNDYDDLGAQLASHGAVVVVPQFVTGLLGACASTQLRAMFGRRAMQWALAESNTSGLPLTGHLDSTRVVVGHSWGGAAAEWSMPVWGARAFVILDPISLLHNVLEWENCNTDLVTLSTTRNHLRPAWRDIAQPVLLLDSGRSGFVATQAEFRGLYPHGPTVHVSTQGYTT